MLNFLVVVNQVFILDNIFTTFLLDLGMICLKYENIVQKEPSNLLFNTAHFLFSPDFYQATLCSMKGCMRALVAQLKSESEDLQQVMLFCSFEIKYFFCCLVCFNFDTIFFLYSFH